MMAQDSAVDSILDVARQIITAAGCASLVTLDEDGMPSSRPVRTFPSDDTFTKISIPTDVESRKTIHVRNNPNTVVSYLDTSTRGYVTMIGRAVLNDRMADKKALWVDAFSAFWPNGPESENFLLIEFTPERIEVRSYTQGVAEDPTHWTPATLEKLDSGGWRSTN